MQTIYMGNTTNKPAVHGEPGSWGPRERTGAAPRAFETHNKYRNGTIFHKQREDVSKILIKMREFSEACL